LEIDETDLYRFTSSSEAEGVIAYEHLEDILPAEGELHKAALIPNPSGPESDLRVLDQDYGDEAARYWLSFLGVRVVPPLPKVLRTTLTLAKEALVAQIGENRARESIGAAVVEITGGEQSTS